jgi:hypothetical protein
MVFCRTVCQVYGEKHNETNTIGAVFETVMTTRGWLSDGCNYPLVINGGADGDTFAVQRNRGTLDLNGDDGAYEWSTEVTNPSSKHGR